MREQILRAGPGGAIGDAELRRAVEASLSDCRAELRRVLLLVPDYTRRHSCGGRLARLYWELLSPGCRVDLLPALGTHAPMTDAQIAEMYAGIPRERFLTHNWRTDVVKVGTVPRARVAEISEGCLDEAVDVEINRHILDGYDLILSIGQVVPHEVAGMANHAKNLFVGCGGSAMINASHILGALYGMERIMGRTQTPVRALFDFAAERFLADLPIGYALTVATAPGGEARLHGLFIGASRALFDRAAELARDCSFTLVDAPLKKVVVHLDEREFRSTWLGNKAIYRTRMAIADGGELIVLAPGVETFGEDPENDRLIRAYGYCGRARVRELLATQRDLRENRSAAAHLIHGSSDGRFSITLCPRKLTRAEVEGVGFRYLPYAQAARRYDPEVLKDGYQRLPDGEEIYYISNPALGLWAVRGAI